MFGIKIPPQRTFVLLFALLQPADMSSTLSQKYSKSQQKTPSLSQLEQLQRYSVLVIDKLYTQIVKVFRLCLKIEPFAVMFWALGIVLTHILKQLTQPDGLASLNSGTGTVLYGRGQ